MDLDNSVSDENSSPSGKSKENIDKHHVNGINNGYSDKHKSHKSEHRDKHRDKDRDRDRDKSKSKEHKSSSKDKDKHISNSKDKHSSHKSSSKDKERGEKDRGDSDKHKDKDKYRDKDKQKDERKSTSSKDKDHKISHDKEHKSNSKEKEGRDKDKEKQKEKSKEKEKDKHRHSSSRDKDKHSSKDKHRDKDKHHSSSKDKEKDKSRKEKDRKSEKYNTDEKKIKVEIKYENDSSKEDSADEDDQKLIIKEESESQIVNTDDRNNSTASSCDYNLSQFKEDSKFLDDDDVEHDSSTKLKKEDDSEDEDIPLTRPFRNKHRSSSRVDGVKRKIETDDEDDTPLVARKKPKKEKKDKKKRAVSEEYEDIKPIKKEKKKKGEVSSEPSQSPKKRKKKEEEQQEVWKWWEEEKRADGVKWSFLEHKGPVFAPPYERIPDKVKFYYDGTEIKLSQDAEEVAGFYAKMLDHDYTTKEVFNNNFFKDWRKVMTEKERAKISDLKKCNFKSMHAYFMDVAEKNRNRTKEEKLALKEKNEAILKEYGFCTIDGHKEKIGNFKIEPPGLFRGRGEHPKMGMLKKRVLPEEILINCSKDSNIPKPPSGHKWKEVRSDNTVTWLASWTENVQNQVKYVMLNPSSKLKGEKDWQKYETARQLHKCIDKIRREYKEDWKSKEMRIRQRAVALYFIDKLALRAGNEKDEDQADTVGCCSLRVEHIELHEKKDDKEYVVVFDFLGKDSIRYYNEVPVEKRVFKNLQLFMENKSPGDDLFDRLNTSVMNKHLNELMEGLTAKVFRTYNASFTLQQQLDKLTDPDYSLSEKILAYNRANRAVAILCNHQRAVPKGHQKSMEKLKEKIDSKRDAIADAERQVKDAQKDAKHGSVKEKVIYDKKKKCLARLKEQLQKLEVQETDRDENKTIALGTSKLNYLDPRISVAWCKKYDVPIEKIYNKTQRDKFRWAIDMAGPDYVF